MPSRKTVQQIRDEAKAEATAELEAFKKTVRETALWAQESQGWCDDGFNEAMRRMGMPEKKRFNIPVEAQVQSTRNARIEVLDALTEEEARASVTEEKVRDYLELSTNETLVSWNLREPKDPDEQVRGDLDSTYTRRAQCENYDRRASGYYCTRERGHSGRQHIAGNGERVLATWLTDAARTEDEVKEAAERGETVNTTDRRIVRPGISNPCVQGSSCELCYMDNPNYVVVGTPTRV
jgi:hypothetical protein